MFLTKDRSGNAPGHAWKDGGPGDVVEVDDALGHELLRIPDGGFHQVDGPRAVAEVDPGAGSTEVDPQDAKAPRSRRASAA